VEDLLGIAGDQGSSDQWEEGLTLRHRRRDVGQGQQHAADTATSAISTSRQTGRSIALAGTVLLAGRFGNEGKGSGRLADEKREKECDENPGHAGFLTRPKRLVNAGR